MLSQILDLVHAFYVSAAASLPAELEKERCRVPQKLKSQKLGRMCVSVNLASPVVIYHSVCLTAHCFSLLYYYILKGMQILSFV